MEIVILMEKEKRTASYVRTDLSSEPPYTADWRLIKEKLKLFGFALIFLQAQIKYLAEILIVIICIHDPGFKIIPAALSQVHP